MPADDHYGKQTHAYNKKLSWQLVIGNQIDKKSAAQYKDPERLHVIGHNLVKVHYTRQVKQFHPDRDNDP